MKVVRQHGETTIPELCGQICVRFCAVVDEGASALHVGHIQLGASWYRFFLDAGLFFWDLGTGPNPDDDLDAHSRYLDLGAALGVIGDQVSSIDYRNCQLRMEFARGARLVVRQGVQDEDARIEDIWRGPEA